jgi:hypothetical protein
MEGTCGTVKRATGGVNIADVMAACSPRRHAAFLGGFAHHCD